MTEVPQQKKHHWVFFFYLCVIPVPVKLDLLKKQLKKIENK